MGRCSREAAQQKRGSGMGDMAEYAESMADMYKAGLITADGTPVEQFDEPDEFDAAGTDGPETPTVRKPDPMRPDLKNGRYPLPNPETGKSSTWQRTTNFTKLTDDTYHLELWKQRNVVVGVARLIVEGRLKPEELARLDVKQDKQRLNTIAAKAQEVNEAYKNADEGTALHTSTELADYANGDLNRVPAHHRAKVRLYLDALSAHGLSIVPDMIERVTLSTKYGIAGKFDRILRLSDGSYVIGDLKTGDDIELALPSIAGQLEAYADGVNTHGVWAGDGWDTRIKVRDDVAVVVWLPSTRDGEIHIVPIDLNEGRRVNHGNLTVRETRKIKHHHVRLSPSVLAAPSQDVIDQHWIEQLNAAWTYEGLVDVAARAKIFGQWNERLAAVARNLTDEIQNQGAAGVMGS
jgi:hypothetical protein